MLSQLLVSFKHHLLHLHVVEEIIILHGLGHGHDILKHESQLALMAGERLKSFLEKTCDEISTINTPSLMVDLLLTGQRPI